MNTRTALITGASDGIGKATARTLAAKGWRVLVHGRSTGKTNAVAAEIRSQTGNTEVTALIADLSRLSDVRRLAEEVVARGELHALVNNAGIGAFQYTLSADGVEMTLAVNHLAHFVLTDLLLHELRNNAPARIITVSSQSHTRAHMHFDDLNLTRGFDANKAYGQSKLANLLFTYELARRLQGSGVTANAFDPGPTMTNLMQGIMRDSTGMQKLIVNALMPRMAQPPESVGQSLAWMVDAPELELVSCAYFDRSRKRIQSSKASYSVQDAQQLWTVSEALALQNLAAATT